MFVYCVLVDIGVGYLFDYLVGGADQYCCVWFGMDCLFVRGCDHC